MPSAGIGEQAGDRARPVVGEGLAVSPGWEPQSRPTCTVWWDLPARECVGVNKASIFPCPAACTACHRWGKTAGVVFVADDLAAWLVGLLADDGRRRLTRLVLGSDQEQAHLPLPEPASRERTIGELLTLLADIGEEATA